MNQIKSFVDRHIGIGADDQKDMLNFLGYKDMYTFIKDVVPESILEDDYLDLGEGLSEMAALKKLDKVAKQNRVFRSYIGQGYYGTVTPKVNPCPSLKLQNMISTLYGSCSGPMSSHGFESSRGRNA